MGQIDRSVKLRLGKSMLIRIKKPNSLSESQVTDEQVFLDRRKVLKQLGFVGMSSLLAAPSQAGLLDWFGGDRDSEGTGQTSALEPLQFTSGRASQEPLTSEAKVISYNNFYEFGLAKSDPAKNAGNFQVNPWQLNVGGLVDKPLTVDYDDLFQFPLEERIYRLRCVEAWSMVVPWVGFSLSTLLNKAGVASGAKYVAFETLHDPKQMPGQRSRFGAIPYPYVEGLRLDEAMHPLTMLVVGVYGKKLPNQNGAPIRLMVPWKYGFKSIKSITKIKLVDELPPTTWNISAPGEYGFYANVNPNVDHPRWSQASERRITRGGLGADERIATQMFNGYADEVASLYSGLDLRRNF